MQKVVGCLALVVLAWAGVCCAAPTDVAGRPYEFVWANRLADDRPVLLPLEDAAGWKVSTKDAVAHVEKTREHRLFGDGAMRVTYRGTGKEPSFTLTPRTPVAVPKGSDTISLWIYGNRQSYMGLNAPAVGFVATFRDAAGKPFDVPFYAMDHAEWFLVQKRLTPEQCARMAGAVFTGFIVRGCINEKDCTFDMTSFAVYHEELKPLTFAARPKRPNRVFPSVPAGVNTGVGELPFPNRAAGVLPPVVPSRVEYRLPKSNVDWDDLALRVDKGPWRRFAVGAGVYSVSPKGPERRARSDVRVRWQVRGQSLVADVEGPDDIAEVRFGALAEFPDVQLFTVPYWSYSMTGGEKRPWIAVFKEGNAFYCGAATIDWTQSNASEPWCAPVTFEGSPALNGGARYRARTDGRRNVCAERLIWSFAPVLKDVLPVIPNPPSPYRSLTAGYQWCHMGAQTDRERDKAYWNDRRRRGLKYVFVGDHEVCMRDGNESFTFRTCAAPGKGGDPGMNNFTRHMIDTLGYLYGPYNNYTDFATVNEYWHADHMTRLADNSLRRAWYRCYAPKPTFAVEMCEKIVPVLQGKFHFNSAYCDVHTCVSPWERCDYDARVPGGGTFAGTFYAYGELLTLQRKYWNGPVYSEGGVHFLYCGLDDGNFAQDQGYRLDINPWLVDFDLERMHPLANNFGMGYPEMFYRDKAFRKNVPNWLDRFLTATIAFGHIGYFLTGNPEFEERGYWMLLALQKVYAQEDVAEIRYGTKDGRLVPAVEALASGAIERSHVAVTYKDGTRVFANGSLRDEGFAATFDGRRIGLPPNGWFAFTGDARVCSVSDERGEACVGPDYAYVSGRGKLLATPFGTTKGQLVRLYEPGQTEEIFVRRDTEVTLPYEAAHIVRLNAKGAVMGAAKFVVTNGVTRLSVSSDATSYRAIKPAGHSEAPAARLADAFTRPKTWVPAAGTPDKRAFTLPRFYVTGMAYRGKGEEAITPASGAQACPDRVAEVGGVSKSSFYMHPPWHGGTGYTFVRWHVKLPKEPLVFSAEIGKIDKSPRGDGTLYRIYVETPEEGAVLVAERQTNEHRWQPFTADLARWAGREINLKLVSDAGPRDNTEADHSSWANLSFRPSLALNRLCPPRPQTAARFKAGTYPPAARPYREAAKMAYHYMTSLPAMTTLVETGEPNQKYQHNAYVSKTHAAHISAMLDWAKLEPEKRETAMRFAKASAEFLLTELEPKDASLAFWPPTYGRKPLKFDPKTDGPYKKPSMIGNEPEGAVKYRGEVMLLYPATVGSAFVNYWRETKDQRFLDAAIGIAETYLKTRRTDGSWPLKMKLATGEPIGENTLVPNCPLELFKALFDATQDPKWRKAEDDCFAWLKAHPLTDWNWDGQFEDIKPEKRYKNPTKHNAVSTMIYILKRFPGDKSWLATCRKIMEFCEKRFVVWEVPASNPKWPTPSVLEQYSCFTPIDASAAKMIRGYLALYQAEGREEDLAKARALADTITRMQKPSGRIPTFWCGVPTGDSGLSNERYDWLNCMGASAKALMMMADVTQDSMGRKASVMGL